MFNIVAKKTVEGTEMNKDALAAKLKELLGLIFGFDHICRN